MVFSDFSGSKSLLKIALKNYNYAKFNRGKFKDGSKIGALYQSFEHNANKRSYSGERVI